MITVEVKDDNTEIWNNPREGEYTFVPLSSLSVGDKLLADHTRPTDITLTPEIIADLANTGASPDIILVRARAATPQDKAKKKKK